MKVYKQILQEEIPLFTRVCPAWVLFVNATDGWCFCTLMKRKGEKKKGIRNESSPPCDHRVTAALIRYPSVSTLFPPPSRQQWFSGISVRKKEEKVFFLVARNIWRKKKGGSWRWQPDLNVLGSVKRDTFSACVNMRTSQIRNPCVKELQRVENAWRRKMKETLSCWLQYSNFFNSHYTKTVIWNYSLFFFFSPRSISRGTSWAWLTADLPPSHRLWPSLLLSIPPVCPAQWEPSITHGRDSDRRKSLYPVRAGRLRSWRARTTNRTVWCMRSQICVF